MLCRWPLYAEFLVVAVAVPFVLAVVMTFCAQVGIMLPVRIAAQEFFGYLNFLLHAGGKHGILLKLISREATCFHLVRRRKVADGSYE